MIVMDWSAVAVGLLIGLVTSGMFFAGLEFGMRLALRTERPVNILVLSAALRIIVLLGVVWGVVVFLGPFALGGFAVAFLAVRGAAMALARAGLPAGDVS